MDRESEHGFSHLKLFWKILFCFGLLWENRALISSSISSILPIQNNLNLYILIMPLPVILWLKSVILLFVVSLCLLSFKALVGPSMHQSVKFWASLGWIKFGLALYFIYFSLVLFFLPHSSGSSSTINLRPNWSTDPLVTRPTNKSIIFNIKSYIR